MIGMCQLMCDVLIQVANALQNTLEDQEKLLAEVTRDKDRFQQRKALEEQVHDFSCTLTLTAVVGASLLGT